MFSKKQNVDPGQNFNKVPVHTMKDDLEALKNHNSQEKFINVEKKEELPTGSPVNQSANNENFQSSPFSNANSAVNQIQTPKPQESFGKVETPINKATKPGVENNKDSNEKEVFLKELAQKRVQEKEEKKNSVIDGKSAMKPKNNSFLYIAIGAIVIAAFLAGAYYFWVTRVNNVDDQNLAVNESQNESSQDNVEVKGNEPSKVESKFTLANPNILSIELDGGSELVKQEMIKISTAIKAESITSPLEFIVTDNNNNPVSFVDFSLASGIKLPAEILSYMDKDFSLYFYNENNSVKLGLMVKIKDPEKVKTLFKKEESNLFNDFSVLFIENSNLKVDKTKFIFSDSNYEGNIIRYANIDSSSLFSIDYSINNTQLFLGTSKNTLRSVIDKVGKEATN